MEPTAPSITGSSFKIKIIIGLILMIILLAILIVVFTPKKTSKPSSRIPIFSPSPIVNNTPVEFSPSNNLPYNLVYGVWSNNSSLVKSYNLTSGQESVIATLPLTVKKVTFLSTDQLLYINKTNNQDYGQELILFSLKDKSSKVIYSADPQFGIDQYVISPNKKNLAVLEISLDANSQQLQGAPTRVYSLDITIPQDKKLIYDITSNESTPIQFPVAITDSGEIYSDKFLPNSGAGWAYGMSVSSFDGTTKEDLASMANGTYGTRPVLSPSGDNLVFAGYDGSKGDGAEIVNGFRRAVISANAIELLDLSSKTRRPLANLSNQNTYSAVNFDDPTGKIVFVQLSQDPAAIGTYTYDMTSQTAKKVAKKDNQSFLTSVDDKNILVVTTDPSQTTIGNLGETYSASVTSFYLFNVDGKSQKIRLTDSLMQFIAVQPAKVLGVSSGQVLPASIANRVLQLIIQQIRPRLPEIRQQINSDPPPVVVPPPPPPPEEPQPGEPPLPPPPPPPPPPRQNLPLCRSIYVAQCLEVNPGNSPEAGTCLRDPGTIFCQDALGSHDAQIILVDCIDAASQAGEEQGLCTTTPLYLYGEAGQQIRVNVGTSVYLPNLPYADSFDVTLQADGKIKSGGQAVESIAYNYEPAVRKLTAPTRGSVASRKDLDKVILFYAQKLGLNDKETSDLIFQAQNQITSPYVFISFFDEQTSKKILPLSFDPQPQTYVNIVFYFKQLEAPLNYTPLPPIFSQVDQRQGFTAVEISELVE